MAATKDFEPTPLFLKIGREVSRGSFGVVFLATLDKTPVAVKQFHEALLSGESIHLQNFKRECEQLKHLNHPNVVKYIGAYQGENGPILVMELMHETLKTYLERNKGKLSSNRVMEICSAVCEGLSHLHGLKNPLIHRDLSDKNVLLTKDGIAKIADFGQSKLLGDLNDTLKTTQPGTITYMPPEALEEKKSYTTKVDSFSLGVLLLEICTQSPPSSSLHGIGTIEEVKRREADLRLLDDAHLLKPLIVWCLQYEELRPTVAGVHNHVTSYLRPGQLKDRLDSANEETASLRKLLGVTEEKLRSQVLLVETISKELEVSTEEKNGHKKGLKDLQEECQFLQEQLEVNRADFEQERKDRQEAAGRYEAKEEEFMEKIQKLTEENLSQANECVDKLMKRDEEIHQLKQIIEGLQQRVNAQTIEVDPNTFVLVTSGESSSLQQKNEILPVLEEECIRLREELKTQKANHDLELETVQERLTKTLKAYNDITLEYKEVCTSLSELQGQLSSSRMKVDEVTNLLSSANDSFDSTKKELDAAKKELNVAKEEIDVRIQQEEKIAVELIASNEERSRLQDECQVLQIELKLNKEDFEKERHDRETAAGRYEEEKEQLLKTIEDLLHNMQKKNDQIYGPSEDQRLTKSQKHSRGGWRRRDEGEKGTTAEPLAKNSRLLESNTSQMIAYEKRLKDRDSRHKAEVAALEERVSQLQRENEAAETDRKDLITAREEIEELHHENAERVEQMKSLEGKYQKQKDETTTLQRKLDQFQKKLSRSLFQT